MIKAKWWVWGAVFVIALVWAAQALAAPVCDNNGRCIERGSLAYAKPQPHHHHRYRDSHLHPPSHLTWIRCGKKRIMVAPSAAKRFHSFCANLVAHGLKIVLAGGWRPGRCSDGHRHPCGLAIDINQVRRNVVVRRFPRGITAIARHYGLVSGGIWCDADLGHFEVYDGTNAPACHHHRRLAKR